MENFDDFMYHLVRTDYKNQGFSVSFGGGYSYDTADKYPVLSEYTLTFKGYKYYLNSQNEIDLETNSNINNMGRLEAFYKRHLNSKNFEYNHPTQGKKVVRFAQPLSIPNGIIGGGGVLDSFEIKLKEVFA